MSDDLISRKDLLGTEQILMTDIVKNNPTARYILEQVLYDIGNSSTAYDVDKVIEQLEENAKYFQSEADELAQNGDWGTATDLQGRAAAYRDAAKIVKSGGAKND